MTLQVSQAVIPAGITPSALTPAASDTIAAGSFGSDGIYARVITSGTATNVQVLDPNFTVQGNQGQPTPAVACPSTGVRMIYIPVSAVNQATGVATVTFSATAGVTYELYRA
jgi:hypothetical protein